MPVHPQLQARLDQMAALNRPALSTLTPDEARQRMKANLMGSGEPEPVASVENFTLPGPAGEIPIRVYTPTGHGPFPVLTFFHGGGWVVCDLDTHDALCRSLTNGAACVVVSVDYRLAPEHPFPAGPEDCYAATQWVAEHAERVQGDARRIAVGGDSAGGNLAAVVALMARQQGHPFLTFQLLLYPNTNLKANTPSMQAYAEGYGLRRDDVIWFNGHYIREEDATNPLASPLLAPDLSGLPPALIVTPEYDVLRDEGEQYGQRLLEAGVPVTLSRYAGMNHGFVSLSDWLEPAQQALNECCQALRTAFHVE